MTSYNMNEPRIFYLENPPGVAISSYQVSTEDDEEDDEEKIEKQEKKMSFRGPDAPLYDAVVPMVYALRLFGFAPYAYSRDEKLVPSHVNSIFSIISGIFYTVTIYDVTYRLIFTGRGDNSRILNTTGKLKVLLNYFVLMANLLHCMRYRKIFAEIWNRIADFDVNLQRKGYTRSEFRTKIWMWIVMCTNILVWFSINQAGMTAFAEHWYKNMSYMMLYVASSIAIYKFIGVAYCLGQRFSHLNRIMGKNESSNYTDDFKTETDTKWVEIMYSDLLNISEKYISLNSTLLFLWLLNLAGHSVDNSFFLLQWLSSNSSKVPFYIVWCLLSWLVAYMLQLVLLHVSCHFAAHEANCMSYVLLSSRHMLLYRNDHGNVNLQLTLHMIHRKLKFLAAGSFDVNLPLLSSMIGVLSTYVVILLQLPEKDDDEDDYQKMHKSITNVSFST